MKIIAEDVLTPKQLEALAIQAEGDSNLEGYRKLGIGEVAFQRRLTRARRILISVGLDPQWKRKAQ